MGVWEGVGVRSLDHHLKKFLALTPHPHTFLAKKMAFLKIVWSTIEIFTNLLQFFLTPTFSFDSSPLKIFDQANG
jgi:hypothetical protein